MLEAFVAGAGGRISPQTSALEPGAAAFYGVVGIEHLVRQARGTTDWYYGDNAFFDAARGRFFRFARNAFQLSKLAKPDYARLAALGVSVSPWKSGGKHIVIIEQSEQFAKLSGVPQWLPRTIDALKAVTDRPLVVRRWNRDKGKASRSLGQDLQNAHALVAHMSAAANEALLAGVPVFVSGPCAASPMASGELVNIEFPRYPEGRDNWAAGLAAMQWTVEEIRQGAAWRMLNG